MSADDWQLPWARCLGLKLLDRSETPPEHLVMLFNAHVDAVEFNLPATPGGSSWSLVLDTADDVAAPGADSHHRARHVLYRRALSSFSPAHLEFHGLPPHSINCLKSPGIAPEYRDLNGVTHTTLLDTKRVLLKAMGLHVGDEEIEEKTLRALRDAAWQTLLPPVAVTRFDPADAKAGSAVVTLSIAETSRDQMLVWRLTGEDGVATWGATRCRDLELMDQRTIGGRKRSRRALMIAVPYLGYHQLHVEVGGEEAECLVIAAPLHSYQPGWMRQGQRRWGVAHQLYSLRGANASGIGDFSALSDLASKVAAAGGACVGVNPLHALSLAKQDDASPYSPSSRCFLNPVYIDLRAVPEFVADPEVRLGEDGDAKLIDYPRITVEKLCGVIPLVRAVRARSAERARDGFRGVPGCRRGGTAQLRHPSGARGGFRACSLSRLECPPRSALARDDRVRN